MTAYFDDKHKELHAVPPDDWQALRAFDERLVWDVTLAAESPGMPEDLRDAIHKAVIKGSITCQPLLPDLTTHQGPDPEDEADHRRILDDLIWDLHTIFHAVSSRGIFGLSDSPISPLRALYVNGEERREKLAMEAK